MKKQSIFVVSMTLLALLNTPVWAGSSAFGSAFFIDKYDQNDDAKVTKREFKKARKATFTLTDEDGSGKVDESEYVQEYANRLDKKIEAERKAHVKQTHIRFGSLDKNEDNRMTWGEYQASGERSFKRYDTNDDKVINALDKEPENRWEKAPNGVQSDTAKATKTGSEKVEWTKEKRQEMRKKYAQRVIHMPTTHNKKGMLTKYDSNGDEAISYDEFTATRRAHFAQTDEDGNGWLNEDEYLVEYANRLDMQIETIRKKQIKQAGVRFGVLDKNDNALMTFKEYQFSGKNRFKRKDTNGDGVVSSDDPQAEHGHHHHHDGDEKSCKGKKQEASGTAKGGSY